MHGLWTRLQLIARRDRIKLPLWIIGIAGSLAAMIPLLDNVYGDEASLQTLYATFGANPAGLFMTGPIDEPTFGALFTIETLLWWGIAVAFVNTMLVVRHTRHNEEIGAEEMMLSGQTSRQAGLFAALIAAVMVNALLAVGTALAMELMQPAWSTESSWVYACGMGLFGLTWAAFATVVVQLVESGRAANGVLAGLIGGAFLLRGIGDFLGETNAEGIHEPALASLFSPFGWLQAVRPLTQPDWTVLIWIAAAAIGIAIVGIMLQARRDIGAGLLPSKSGNARAKAWLQSVVGLSWYVQKNVVLGWAIGVVVLALTIGVLVPQMSDVYDSSDSIRATIQAIGGTGALIPSFMSAMISISAVMVIAYGLHALGKLRSEEASGRTEQLFATRVSRTTWLTAHVGIVAVCGTIMLALVGGVLAACINVLSDETVQADECVLAALSYAPVLWAFIAGYVLLFGLVPRAVATIAWVYFGYVAFALWIGPMIDMPEVLMNVSLFSLIAAAPVEAIEWGVLAILTTGAVAAFVIGLALFRRRDIG